MGQLGNDSDAVRIACASFAIKLARRNVRQIKAVMQDPMHRAIFPKASLIDFRGVNTSEAFDVPGGSNLQGVGARGGITGFSVDVAIIDDPTKDAKEALSADIQQGLEDWYEAVIMSRLQERSGTLIIGTPWSANDLLARVRRKMGDDARFTLLSFPALNHPDEIGYNPALPEGPLVPKLHSETKLREMKRFMSSLWWSAMYQQAPLAEFGAIFKRQHLQHYRKADLPKFNRVVMSVDATFKDGEASDYVFVGVWGKTAGDDVYLIDWRREQLAFMATARAMTDLKAKHPAIGRGYVEEAANGAALLDMLKKHFPWLEGVKPLGSKEARAHAVSWVWENKQVYLPHPDEVPGINPVVAEITSFPDTVTGHDDCVDGMTIALQQLCLRNPVASMITQDILRAAGVRV
jgi:predicted phage terminase large subunit-like protein